MKKAFTLIEVIISITLMSFVIVLLLNLKEQNLYLIEKAQKSQEKNEYFSPLVLSSNLYNTNNENIYLSDILSFSKYEHNKNVKNFKITVKNTALKSKVYEVSSLNNIEFKAYAGIFSNKDTQKKYYFFKIN